MAPGYVSWDGARGRKEESGVVTWVESCFDKAEAEAGGQQAAKAVRGATAGAEHTLSRRTEVRWNVLRREAIALKTPTYPDSHAARQIRRWPSDLVEKHVGRDLHEDVAHEKNRDASLKSNLKLENLSQE